jgi:hypothetical protein
MDELAQLPFFRAFVLFRFSRCFGTRESSSMGVNERTTTHDDHQVAWGTLLEVLVLVLMAI